MNDINPQADEQRQKFRKLGKLILAVGVVCFGAGLMNFFMAFSSGGKPNFLWLSFIGVPFIFVGVALLKFGYFGAMFRFVAGESMPVAKDSINYLGKNTTEGVGAFSKAAFSALKDNDQPELSVEERLNKLKELLDKGLVSEEDYEKQQGRILKDL
jgi:hypothetical protein